MLHLTKGEGPDGHRLVVSCDLCGLDVSNARAGVLIFTPPPRGGRSRALWACKRCATSQNARNVLGSGEVETLSPVKVVRRLSMALLHESVF